MAQILNVFPIKLTPATWHLPTLRFASFEHSTEVLGTRYSKFFWYRQTAHSSNDEPPVLVVLLNGPLRPERLEWSDLATEDYPGLVSKVVLRGLESHFRQRGAQVYKDRFHLYAHWVGSEAPGGVRISPGLRIKVHRLKTDKSYGLVVSWDVHAEFTKSLADGALREVALNMPLVLRYEDAHWFPPRDLRMGHNRFCGHARRIISPDVVEVAARGGETVALPAKYLFLEATPATLRQLDERATGPLNGQSAVRRMQECSSVLKKAGGRNMAVLKDRLRSIVQRMSPEGRESLSLRLELFDEATALVDLRPLHLP